MVVAHRLSTLHKADYLVCIEDGAVCEKGTPEELLSAEGMFAELAKHQQMACASRNEDSTDDGTDTEQSDSTSNS